MVSKALHTVIVTAILTAAAVSGAVAQSPERIGVGSLNLHQPPFGSNQTAHRIEHVLRLTRLDVLVVNDVPDSDAGPARRNDQLEKIVALANERDPEAEWTYRLFPRRNPSTRDRLTGIFWNQARVELEQDSPLEVDTRDEKWQWLPYAARFSAGPGLTDIVVVPARLHPSLDGSDCGVGTRLAERENLSAAIGRLERVYDDDDIIVLGDTDCLRGDPEARERFSEEGQLSFPAGELEGFSASPEAYAPAIFPKQQHEFRTSDRYFVVLAESWKAGQDLPDHLILVPPILVMPDDD